MKRTVFWLCVIGLTLALPIALGRPPYRLAAIQQLHLVPDKDGTRTVTCQFCHVNPGGGPPWNPFGELVRSNFRGNINQALYDALSAMKDSDGDGYVDVLEVFAGTWPGNPDSKPLVDPAFLKANFEKAGGMQLYKPAQ